MKETELAAKLKGRNPKSLEPMLVEYSQRWRHYVSLIWTISEIFIPLSLSGIATIAFDNWLRTVFVGAFSIVLIWIWYFITRELRLAADNNRQVYVELESKLLQIKPPLNYYGLQELIPSFKDKKIHVRELRKVIAIIITAGWSIVILASVLNLSRFVNQ